jgi:HK97 family phage major capsid protein
VTSSYADEAAPVADESPALLQPEVHIEKAHTFIAFSHELGGDWPGLVAELGKLFADSRDALESEMFLTGAGHGSHEPEGLLVGATTTFDTAVASTFSADDVYALLNEVPPRFAGRTSVLANQALYDVIYRMYNPTGEEPPLILADGSLLGRPKYAWSDMSVAVGTPGELVMVAGDLSTFRIVERVGMSVELIPNLMGATFTPTGQRGLYAWWRNGSAVLVPNALRVLKIKASA